MILSRRLTHLCSETILGREVDFYHDRRRKMIVLKGKGLRLAREIAPHASARAACAAYITEMKASAAQYAGVAS